MKQQATPPLYRIEVAGRLEAARALWLDNLALSVQKREEGAVTRLEGPLPDQAALMGLLRKIHGLGLTLLLVRRL